MFNDELLHIYFGLFENWIYLCTKNAIIIIMIIDNVAGLYK